jgi:hypothetical protein
MSCRTARWFAIAQGTHRFWVVAAAVPCRATPSGHSNQVAQGIGPITGGLLEGSDVGNFLLDHDQRNTASAVNGRQIHGEVRYRFKF